MGANEEQLKAIAQSHGLTLKAGAGSGKTFVIVNHIHYLIEQLKNKLEGDEPAKVRSHIRSFFSSVVLMTFTKKAAGEILIRVFQKLDEHREKYPDIFWNEVLDNFNLITITTIHGLCHKIIQQGEIPGVTAGQPIVSDGEFRQKVYSLIEKWLLTKGKDTPIHHFLLTHLDSVASLMIKVLKDPSVRFAWSYEYDELDKWHDYGSLLGLQVLGKENIRLDEYQDYSDAKWFEYLTKLNLTKDCFSTVHKIYDFLQKISSLGNLPRKNKQIKELPLIVSLLEDLKIVKKFASDNLDDLEAFMESKSHVLSWEQEFKELYLFIEKSYQQIEGMTFADLEYFVMQGLNNTEVAQRIEQKFKYLIVDEFQDTSWSQFQIIKTIINNDYSRLFVVGDIKQAIYGFRGGEVGVFKSCEKKISNTLNLSSNYRSSRRVVEFNNNFFDYVFSLGQRFSGQDPFCIEFTSQVPMQKKNSGSVELYTYHVDDSGFDKISSADINRLEARLICDWIHENDDEVCVLYKKLSPSSELIANLIDRQIGFTAQVKIPFCHDPIVGIFELLVRWRISSEKLKSNNQYFDFIFSKYIELLGVQTHLSFDNCNRVFMDFSKVYDPCGAFRLLLHRLGFSNSNYKNNIQSLEGVAKVAGHNFERIHSLITKMAEEKYQLDFVYGHNPDRVKIMSTHLSKGLEFPTVIVAGLLTNGKNKTDNDLFGKLPRSFKWKKDYTERRYYKSPGYIYEGLVNRQKAFSESKRLFYVACTRAKSKLLFFDFDFKINKPRIDSNSWISAMRSWLRTQKSQELLELHQKEICLKDIFMNSGKPKPLIYSDTMGVTVQNVSVSSHAMILPELSVTKMIAALSCPRKFYLQSICKIKPPNKLQNAINTKESTEGGVKSSSKRGVEVHREMDLFMQKKIDQLSYVNQDWVNKNLIIDRKDQIQTEKTIKFLISGQMVSGTADLVILREGYVCQIWDYKTGQKSLENQSIYYHQLMMYALGFHKLSMLGNSVKLRLAYLDIQEIVDTQVSLSELATFENSLMKALSSTHEITTSHCQVCSYQNICQVQ